MITQSLFTLFGALAFTAMAAPVLANCNATRCTSQIDRIYVNAAGVYVSTTSDAKRLNCRLNEVEYISLSLEHLVLKEIYALLLTAKSANMEATLRIEEGSRNCRLAYAVLE